MFDNQRLTLLTSKLGWLGLWLDPRLAFGAHIRRMHQRGRTTIAQILRIIRCYHVLNLRETQNLIALVLKPRILFGSFVWFNTQSR